LKLPFERSSPCDEAKPADGVINWEIAPEISQRLDRVASQNKSTYFSVRLAVFLAALAETGAQNDLVIGTYSTGRTRLEWQSILGMFANTLTLRFRWNPRLTFAQWARVVSETFAAAQEHDSIPHHLLRVKLSREGIRTPQINALFCVAHHSAPRLIGDILLTKLTNEREDMPWGFTMLLDRQREDHCHAWFDARLYDPRHVRQFLNRYLQLLDVLSQHPKSRLSRSMKTDAPSVLHLSSRQNSRRFRDAA
jgi:non-ribosomal peptide synthetase component F